MSFHEPVVFPSGFLWGSATASHQVEGDNRWNDWWMAEQRGLVPHRSGAACRHYEMYEHDFDLARGAGQNAHRFSIEWSRVEPAPGVWDEDAIAHYREVIDALRARGIEPVVTLHHFTLPTWVAERGGWANRRTVRRFARYVSRMADALGDAVRYWVTINEPTVYVKHAYVVGDWPPCAVRAWWRAVRAFGHMARGHRAARARLRARWPHAQVGFAHSAPVIQPGDPSRLGDRTAAWLRDWVLNRAFFALLRRGERGEPPFDFIGLNYYTRAVVRGGGGGLIPFVGTECLAPRLEDRGVRSDLGWEVYPAGLGATLRRFARYGVPLLVTENGIATTDEELRASFLCAHLEELAGAVRDGVDVRGYFYWSLLDNFEWTQGTEARFGLFHVDFDTQERRSRPALDRYRAVCAANRYPPDVPWIADGSSSRPAVGGVSSA
ncbi:MAG TPA: glycoside hydrolase family 1 protein [Gemmatimonadaceae bacterium]|nr:glycoside hydrolase family 1 protein [Gemmatimonadaceae bacterium]